MEKKNTDYSASAVKMVNSKVVADLMETLHVLRADYDEAIKTRNASIPVELQTKVIETEAAVNGMADTIKSAIEQYGSYQDLDKGWYAVKQRKVSKSYDAPNFKLAYPQYAPAVIIETVDTTKLNGLIKGGLLTEDYLKTLDIIKESESFAYIIK